MDSFICPEQIDEVLEAEFEYMKAVGIVKNDNQIGNDDVIDFGYIKPN